MHHAVLLTGMGMDGARGMLNLRQKGAVTYADERSCVVFGMPRAAIELNAVDEIQDLVKIAPVCWADLLPFPPDGTGNYSCIIAGMVYGR